MQTILYKYTDEAKRLMSVHGHELEPVRGTVVSAGLDLKVCSKKPVHIAPYQTVKIGTGICICLESGIEYPDINNTIFKNIPKFIHSAPLVGLVVPRSSCKGLQLENTVGIIDQDYQGEIFLKLYNKTEDTIILSPCERIAQLIILPCVIPELVEVEEFRHITARAGAGDGSTGRF